MDNETVGTNTFTGDANIQNVGNDWYRISVTTSHTINSINAYIHAHATDNTTNELDGCDFLLWGAQLETLPYASSYIPTNGSTVTRNKDQASRSGLQNHINSTEGVLYAEFSVFDIVTNSKVISIYKTSSPASNAVVLYYNGNRIAFDIFNPSGTVSVLTDISNAKELNKVAIKYKSGDIALWFNGVELVTRTNTLSLSGLDKLDFDFLSNNDFEGRVRSLAVFNEALTDEELAKITSTTQQEVFYEMRDKMQQIDADYYEFGDYTTRLKKLF